MTRGDALPPPIRSVLHATDLSDTSGAAFVHALKIALIRRTRFDILNVDEFGKSWQQFPQVRETLVRWGVIPPQTAAENVLREAGIDVSKIAKRQRNAAKAILEYQRSCPADLLVLSTGRRRGPAQLLRPSVAGRVAASARVLTLFVQSGVPGFVRPDSGELSLRRVVVPINRSPSPQPAIDAVVQMFATLGTMPEQVLLVHAGDDPPAVELRESAWPWEWRALRGGVADGIAEVAREIDADLVVMASGGRKGVGDALLGSMTERVVRRAPCPVLMVPVSSRAYR